MRPCKNPVVSTDESERCFLHRSAPTSRTEGLRRTDEAVPEWSVEDDVIAAGSSVQDVTVPLADDRELVEVLEAAARVQELVPTATVVGGTAAALWAGHRHSHDADHVLADLHDRFEMVLDALEGDEGWATNRLVPGKVILGNLGGVEIGVRQLIRRRPLEVTALRLPSGRRVRVPTLEETLRIKAYLVVRRNQVREYLDVAALADHMGLSRAARVLSSIDLYYGDQNKSPDGVASQIVRQLADPSPADRSVTRQLHHYKRLRHPWKTWSSVVSVCRALAVTMIEGPP